MFDYQCFTKFKSAQKRCIGLYTVDSIMSYYFKQLFSRVFQEIKRDNTLFQFLLSMPFR